jgi:hypothetical protein
MAERGGRSISICQDSGREVADSQTLNSYDRRSYGQGHCLYSPERHGWDPEQDLSLRRLDAHYAPRGPGPRTARYEHRDIPRGCKRQDITCDIDYGRYGSQSYMRLEGNIVRTLVACWSRGSSIWSTVSVGKIFDITCNMLASSRRIGQEKEMTFTLKLLAVEPIAKPGQR